MEMKGERRIALPRPAVWDALNDPRVLQAAIPGCESFERTGEDRYAVAVVAALGPVRARFRGKLTLADVVVAESYTLRFEGEGGVAGFAHGEAQVWLESEAEAATLLRYAVASRVGGRLAQVGNRLIDSAALKLADQFFAAFERELAGAGPAGEVR